MKQSKSHLINTILIFSVFCIYAITALFLILVSADVYEENVSASSESYNMRTSLLYIGEKLRQSEEIGQIRLGETEQSDAIIMQQVVADSVYETWIYIEDGYLCEVLLAEGMEPLTGIGQRIMPLSAMALSETIPGLLEVEVTDTEGNVHNSRHYIESGTGVGIE